jgi:hypothetical protein
MLKISIVDSSKRRRLVLEGMLTAPWVSQLRVAWMRTRTWRQGRKVVLDLANVTQISKEGEQALAELLRKGAWVASGGSLTKHTLQISMRRNSISDTVVD